MLSRSRDELGAEAIGYSLPVQRKSITEFAKAGSIEIFANITCVMHIVFNWYAEFLVPSLSHIDAFYIP